MALSRKDDRKDLIQPQTNQEHYIKSGNQGACHVRLQVHVSKAWRFNCETNNLFVCTGKQGRDDASGQLVDREGEGERKIQATQKGVPGLDNVENKIENDHANDPRHSSAEVPKRDNENISLGSKHTAGDQGQCASSGYSSGSSADGQSKPGTAKGTSERRSHDAKSAK